MKINELIEMSKKANANVNMSKYIKTKYLPFKEKRTLVDTVINRCIMIEDGMVVIDEFDKYIAFTVEIINAYTTLEFDEDFDVAMQEYDMLCEANLLNKIIEAFEGEYNTVLNMLNIKTEEVLKQNTIEYQVIKFLNGLNDKLDAIMPMLEESASSWNFGNLGIEESDIQSLMKFINKA